MAAKPLYIVTGASGGMGVALTEALARASHHVIMACRNVAKATPLCETLRERYPEAEIEILPLDLASFASIAAFVRLLQQRPRSPMVLLNNAGSMNGSFSTTAEGIETTLAVNYLGTAALTLLLLPQMEAGGRIINTLSCTYRIGRITPSLFTPDAEHYTRFGAYSTSKLALLLFSELLRDRIAHRGIALYVADPGVVSTGMITMHRWFDPLADWLFRPFIKTPEQGAATALLLATSDPIPAPDALYWAGRKPRPINRRPMQGVDLSWFWDQSLTLLRSLIPELPEP